MAESGAGSRRPYRLVFTPEAEASLAGLEGEALGQVERALRCLAERGWAGEVERIERNKYRLRLARHLLLFRVFDDKRSLLVELVARRSWVMDAAAD